MRTRRRREILRHMPGKGKEVIRGRKVEVATLQLSRRRAAAMAIGVAACAFSVAGWGQVLWRTVANNGDEIPGTTGGAAVFNSYNQPAVNAGGLVVFRARSSGAGGSAPVHGIYERDMAGDHPIVKIVARGDAVPQPNNTFYNGVPASFEEFASTPRIGIRSSLIATRGQSQPVWTYLLGGTETRIGTAGLFVDPRGSLTTAASQLGAVVDDLGRVAFPWYSVPGANAGTRFDQFPGAPSVTDGRYLVFKGNYTNVEDMTGRTGVYFRDLAAPSAPTRIRLIADSATVIPNQPAGGTVTFGSTAPPSAANRLMVFTGLDNEDAPTLGGIYRAPLQPSPPLEVLVGIGDPVPDEPPGANFNAFGEALSLSADGRYVSFWGAWGTETFEETLFCPTDGNVVLIVYCNETYPNGYTVSIPVHQGIFVHDARTGETIPIAKTLSDGIVDFVYWVFSGRPPGTGDDGGEEPARWRSSAFSALSGDAARALLIAYKASKAGFDGIYVKDVRDASLPPGTIVETTRSFGQDIDAEAPADSVVSSVGIERDGFRDGNLVLALGMLYTDPGDPTITAGWGGIYLTRVVTDTIFRDGFE